MDTSTFNEYLEKRYNDQLSYYEKASQKNQRYYKIFQWTLIILSTVTTILASLTTVGQFDMKYLIVISSAFVAIISAALKTFQYQELWVNYRLTIERLRPEYYYYQFNVGEYASPGIDKEMIFVSRVESILNKEHDNWPISKKGLKSDGTEAE